MTLKMALNSIAEKDFELKNAPKQVYERSKGP